MAADITHPSWLRNVLGAIRGAVDWVAKLAVGYDVFISYASDDRAAYARELYRRLAAGDKTSRPRSKPLLVFFAREEEERLIGQQLKPALARAVRRSRAVVFLDSPAGRKSQYVAQEVSTALDAGRLVVPLVGSGVDKTPRPPWSVPIDPAKASVLDGITGVDDREQALAAGTPSESTLRSLRVTLAGRRRIRRFLQLCSILATIAVGLVAYSAWLAQLRRLDELAARAAAEMDLDARSLADVTHDAARAIRWYHHTPDADDIFRRASAASVKRRRLLSDVKAVRVSATTSVAARLTASGVDRTHDPFSTDAWTPVIPGAFDYLAMDEGGGVLAAANSHRVDVWNDAKLRVCLDMRAGEEIRQVGLDPLGRRLAVLSERAETDSSSSWWVTVQDVAQCGQSAVVLRRRIVKPLLASDPEDRPRLQLSPGGQALVAASRGGWVLWRLHLHDHDVDELDRHVAPLLKGDLKKDDDAEKLVIDAEVFSHSGDYLAIASAMRAGESSSSRADGPRVLVFGVSAPTPVAALNHFGPRRASSVAFSPDDTLLAANGNQGLKVWEWKKDATGARARGECGGASTLAFARGGALVTFIARSDSSLRVMDVESGLCLPGSYREAFVPASLHGGGPQGEVIVVEGQQASTDAALYECRTSPAVRRINDEDYKAVEGGAFNSHMDVALATGDSLEIATHDQHQLTSVPVVPVDGFARYVGVTEAGVVIGGVTSDDTVVGVVECPGTACLNLKVTNIGPSTTAVAVEPTTGTLMRGCANGSIVEGLQGDCGISPLSSRSVRTLAVSASAIVRVDRSGRVCWSSRSRPEACHGLPPSGEPGPVTAVALSADGSRVAVARAGSADGPTPVEVFACGPVERLISADACAFERQSRIFSPGRVVGISLTAADESLTTLSMWENQAVVQRFPLTARSILAASGF